jgi:hypothetical protein
MEVSIVKNEINDYTMSELNYIRETIETMNKFNQVEVLRILGKHNDVILNENKYGVHVNLSELKKDIIDELNVYINYVNTQEIALHKIEKQKEDFKNTYFTKDNKDNLNK